MEFVKMFYKFVCIIFITIKLIQNSYAIDINEVFAYPVPFIPKIHNILTIKIADANYARCTIYDITGDTVKVLTGTSDIKWNGRNDRGTVVSPGLYIIKIELEKNDGEYKKKIIRILIQ